MNQIKAYMAHHKKRIALIAAFFFLILLGRALYQILFPPKTAKTIPYVRTITVGTDETSGTYTYPGTVRGKYESVLSFQVNGRITKRLVNLGDTVKAGDVLMTIDPKDVREQVRNAEAAVNAAASRAKLPATMPTATKPSMKREPSAPPCGTSIGPRKKPPVPPFPRHQPVSKRPRTSSAIQNLRPIMTAS